MGLERKLELIKVASPIARSQRATARIRLFFRDVTRVRGPADFSRAWLLRAGSSARRQLSSLLDNRLP